MYEKFCRMVAWGWCLSLGWLAGEQVSVAAELRAGDRVVLLGATFIERMQTCEQIETWLTMAQPGVTFRNLGWSGDNVFGEARALFGSREDGFRRLEADLKAAQPTVILVAYGTNEAHDGEAGLASFTQGLDRLLGVLQRTGARVVLLLPAPSEKVAGPFPAPGPFNRQLELYRDQLKKAAAQQKLQVIDLAILFERARLTPPTGPLTTNGLHLDGTGYRRLAPQLAAALGLDSAAWYVDYDPQNAILEAQGCLVEIVSRTAAGDVVRATAPPEKAVKPREGSTDGAVSLRILDRMLPPPVVPNVKPIPVGTLRVSSLAAGDYELRVDERPLLTASARQWAQGVDLMERGGSGQASELREAIVEKNLLYMHRYRPQNETYLFLFRKHEQGNNAVEIPQFDPLVAKLETRIAELRVPQPHLYQLVPVKRP